MGNQPSASDLVIQRTANGWMVFPNVPPNYATDLLGIYVFQTFGGLCEHLRKHWSVDGTITFQRADGSLEV